jgi:hypothetical protein
MSTGTQLYPTHNSHWKETIEHNTGRMQKLHHENTVKKSFGVKRRTFDIKE